MISKVIHYCWFGRNELPEKAKKCIASWKKYCPDYEIIEWNEDNFDINQNAYTRYCYESKKYAFLSDYVRLRVVYEQGGFYFDTDVEIVRPIDELAESEAFFGFETDEYVASGLGFGATVKHTIIQKMLAEYDQLLDGEHGTIGCPILNTEALKKEGLIQDGTLQVVGGAVIYPIEYFNPYDDPTGRLNKTKNTYSIHWYAKTWMSKKQILRSTIAKPIHRIFGKDILHKIRGKK